MSEFHYKLWYAGSPVQQNSDTLAFQYEFLDI